MICCFETTRPLCRIRYSRMPHSRTDNSIGRPRTMARRAAVYSVSSPICTLVWAGLARRSSALTLALGGLAGNGAASLESAVEGAVARLRPILMTALMAGLGLLPAALSHGVGSETQRPFAVVIIGGIVSATFFTLLLLPLAYGYFARTTPE